MAITSATVQPVLPDPTLTAPAQPAPQPTVTPAKTARPGFTEKGRPLPDDQVWGLTFGDPAKPVMTTDLKGPLKGDEPELTALMGLASSKPQEFCQRLLADSMNGTPVEFSIVQAIGPASLTADFTANKGKIEGKVTIEMTPDQIKSALGQYISDSNKFVDGQNPQIVLDLTGKLTKEGGIEDIRFTSSAANLPRLSMSKIQGTDDATLTKRIGDILGQASSSATSPATGPDQASQLLWFVKGIVSQLNSLPLGALSNLITNSSSWTSNWHDVTKPHGANVGITLGQNKYALDVKNLLGNDSEGKQANVEVTLAGGIPQDDTDAITIDSVKFFTGDKISMAFDENGQPKFFAVKGGKKTAIDDQVGMVMMALPMAMSFLGGDM
jgi:hypothetical protein